MACCPITSFTQLSPAVLLRQSCSINPGPYLWIDFSFASDGLKQGCRTEVHIHWRSRRRNVISPIERISSGRDLGLVSLPVRQGVLVAPEHGKRDRYYQATPDHDGQWPTRLVGRMRYRIAL